MSNPCEHDARSALRAKHYDLDTAETPALLRRCFDRREPRSVTARGDIGIVDEPLTGFFCSIRCPGDIILRIYDLARALRGTDMTLVGGFQSPMEKEFLDLLLRGSARVVVCPARSTEASLAALRQARAQLAVTAMQKRGHEMGADRLTLQHVNAEIGAARRERSG